MYMVSKQVSSHTNVSRKELIHYAMNNGSVNRNSNRTPAGNDPHCCCSVLLTMENNI